MAESVNEKTQRTPNQISQGRAKFALAIICVSNLFAWCCSSLIAPFFPIEAAKKGTTETIIGLIYSLPKMVVFLSSPVVGSLVSRTSPKLFYISGLCMFGTCHILFGFLNKAPTGAPFIASCFAVRAVEGLGYTAIVTAGVAIAGYNFPDKIGTVYGILSTLRGIGSTLGPAVSGGLFELGGFGLPFWAGVSLAVSPVLFSRLKTFDLSQGIVGVMFIIVPVAHSTTTAIWGWLLDRYITPIPLMIGGTLSTAISLLLLGPAPFFLMKPSLGLTITALLLMGLSVSPLLVSSFKCVVEGARELGFKDDQNTFGLVGGVVLSFRCLGAFLGPLLGGALSERFGFGWTMTFGAGLLVLQVIIFTPFLTMLAYRRCNSKYITLHGTDSTEKETHELK